MPEHPDGGVLPVFRDVGHAITAVEYAAVWRIVENCNHLLCFHSALLSKGGRGVAIVGPSTAGKSTLATALWSSGWDFLCDDLTIALGNRAVAGPRRVSLREGSRELVGEELWSGVQKTPGYRKTLVGCLFHPMQEATESSAVDLSAVVFLRRNGAPEGVAGPTMMNPARAAIALLPYTNLVRNVSFPEALAPVADLMSQVAGYDLPRAPLPEMVASVERLCGV
ncbi:MAG: hypothetical protein ACSLFK_10970 [Gemmatimonadaceae bacterium]